MRVVRSPGRGWYFYVWCTRASWSCCRYLVLRRPVWTPTATRIFALSDFRFLSFCAFQSLAITHHSHSQSQHHPVGLNLSCHHLPSHRLLQTQQFPSQLQSQSLSKTPIPKQAQNISSLRNITPRSTVPTPTTRTLAAAATSDSSPTRPHPP